MGQPHAPPPGTLGSPPPAVDRGPRTIRTAVTSEHAATVYAAVYSAMLRNGGAPRDAQHTIDMLDFIEAAAAGAVHKFAALLDQEVGRADPTKTR